MSVSQLLIEVGAVPHFYIWVRLWAGVLFHYSIVRMMTALTCMVISKMILCNWMVVAG